MVSPGTMAHYDIVVCGLGAVGSAALHRLALRRPGGRTLRLLGLERFAPGHDRGSSHGQTRIIRLSYFEHPSYVPLLRRSYELWRELEAAAGRPLLQITGIVEIGPPTGTLVPATLAAARLHDLPHDVLSSTELMRRHPAFRLPADYVAVAQPDGGILAAESAVLSQIALARAAGAEIRTKTVVRAIEPGPRGIRITTDHDTIEAGTAIVAAGPWLGSLIGDLPVRPRVTRQVAAWFQPRMPALFRPEQFPVFLLESRHGMHYGFPAVGPEGVKAARHHHLDEAVDPDQYARAVSLADQSLIRTALAEHLPDADGPPVATRTCLYTMIPDGNFVIDRLPTHPDIIVASPCSGHGFKFAPVVGEILADLATAGTTRHDIARFRFDRFS
jgi:sarcosine oxidase